MSEAIEQGHHVCPACRRTVEGPPPAMVDYHALVKREGIERISEVAVRSVGQVGHFRSGWRPMDLDVLYRLKVAFPDFDTDSSVLRIGAIRIAKGRDDLTRTPRPAPRLADEAGDTGDEATDEATVDEEATEGAEAASDETSEGEGEGVVAEAASEDGDGDGEG